MSNYPKHSIGARWITAHRGKKNPVDPKKPYAFFVEKERQASGKVETAAALFLTNRECALRCLMCDLWKNTTDTPLRDGVIPGQIAYALAQLPQAQHLKLYNSGSFFDPKAIPPADYHHIADLATPFKTLTVESHPRYIDEQVTRFSDLIAPDLEVAIGLETIHPDVLPRLNKRMSPEDFQKAVTFLHKHGIAVRAFVLLRPPFLTETEGVWWAKRSLNYAFDLGIETVTVIPVRGGNGAMEVLAQEGFFSPPALTSLEEVLAYGIAQGKGRVLADLWDIEQFSACPDCFETRVARLQQMNLTQKVVPHVHCHCLQATKNNKIAS